MTESLVARYKEDAEIAAAEELEEAAAASAAATASFVATAVVPSDSSSAPYVETTEEVGSPDFFTDALKLFAAASGIVGPSLVSRLRSF